MKSLKYLDKKWSWIELVSKIEPNSCLLLKGSDNDFILAWEIQSEIKFGLDEFDFNQLDSFINNYNGHYIFGYLTYDVKNKIEPKLKSENFDLVLFPDAHFFVPAHVLVFKNNTLQYYGDSTAEEITLFFDRDIKQQDFSEEQSVQLEASTSKKDYLKNFQGIKNEIQFGTIYEMNYCLNFTVTDTKIHPFKTFQKLTLATEAPFSCYFHLDNHFALCASPERYIQRIGNRLISEPIKGTAARGANTAEDEKQKKLLRENPKEQAENVMIVDLVRNDLSKIATKNSVHVDELFGVKTLKTVHQLVSTVSCTLKENTTFVEIIKATFPMGSMTGAPKISAMKQSERFENFKRGLYSGTIGYIEPNGNFDFNVVIRSILYNSNTKVVSCGVGGAITINAEPEKEYDECLLKLAALQKALC